VPGGGTTLLVEEFLDRIVRVARKRKREESFWCMEGKFDKMTMSARDGDGSPNRQRHQTKQEVCAKILSLLKEIGHESVKKPGFAEELQRHFDRLPSRYALDVHTDRAEDVLTHKRLLEEARIPENRPAFHVRAVQILPADSEDESMDATSPDEMGGNRPITKSRLPLPVFGSTPNLEALAADFNNKAANYGEDEDGSNHSQSGKLGHGPMHEVTLSTIDRPKLLSQMSALLADVGLNILEAHVFSTTDGYSLNVFVVDGWPTEVFLVFHVSWQRKSALLQNLLYHVHQY